MSMDNFLNSGSGLNISGRAGYEPAGMKDSLFFIRHVSIDLGKGFYGITSLNTMQLS
jgi:hypothetical protein